MRSPYICRSVRLGASLTVALGAGCGGGDSLGVTSAPAPAAPKASSLVIAHAAAGSLAKHPIDTIRVEIHDALGALFAAAPVSVSLTVRSPSGAGPNVAGPTSSNSSNGVATFVGLTVADAGNYTLTVSASGLTAVSQPLLVDPQPVVVDSTALRLVSDSAARAAGIYAFQGSAAATIDTGRVIVGAQAGGFVRRVTKVDRSATTVTATTIPASLDEIMQNDSVIVRLTQASSSIGSHGTRNVAATPRMLFRSSVQGVALQDGGTITISNLTLASVSGSSGLVVSSATLVVQPALDISAHWGDLRAPMHDFHVAMTGTVTFQASTVLGVAGSFDKSGSVLLGTLVFPFVIPPGIPSVFEVPITLEWSLGANGRADIRLGWTSSASSTVGANWTPAGGWQPLTSASFTFTPQFPTPEIQASAHAHVGLQVKPRIVIAGTLGGDAYVQPFAEGNATADAVSNSWSTSCRSAIGLGLDLDLKILSHTLASYSKGTELASATWPICAYSGRLLPVFVTVSPSAVAIGVGDNVTLAATVANSNDATVVWSSSNAAVATVDSRGVVRGVAVGTARVTALHAAGATGSGDVTVSARQATITISSINSGAAPANIAALKGQVDVTMDVNSGGQTITEIDLSVGGQIVGRQLLSPGTSAGSAAAAAAAAAPITMSFDSAKFPNGTYALQGSMFLKGNSTAVTTSVIQITIKN